MKAHLSLLYEFSYTFSAVFLTVLEKIIFRMKMQSPVTEEISYMWIGLYTKIPWVISHCASEETYFLFTQHHSDFQSLTEICFQGTISICF